MNLHNKTKNQKYYVYGLKDPRYFQPRYVGITNNPKSRYSGHICPSQLKYKTLKNNWIKSILNKNLKPELFIIEEVNNLQQANEREIFWIKYLKDQGYKLTNGTLGGDGTAGHTATKKWRKDMSKLFKGRKFSPESCKKMSESMKGNTNGKGKAVKIDSKIEQEIWLKHSSGLYSIRSLSKSYTLDRYTINRILRDHKEN